MEHRQETKNAESNNYFIRLPYFLPEEIENISILPKAGRLKYFLKNRVKLTHDPTILETAQDYNISFTVQPEQFISTRVATNIRRVRRGNSQKSEEEIDMID